MLSKTLMGLVGGSGPHGLSPKRCRNAVLVGESGAAAPVLTGAASALPPTPAPAALHPTPVPRPCIWRCGAGGAGGARGAEGRWTVKRGVGLPMGASALTHCFVEVCLEAVDGRYGAVQCVGCSLDGRLWRR